MNETMFNNNFFLNPKNENKIFLPKVFTAKERVHQYIVLCIKMTLHLSILLHLVELIIAI